MGAEELVKQGDLAGALSVLQGQVRAKPADADLRIFLFQLLVVMGDGDRALTQLNVAGDLDPQTFPMVQAYREALRCEALRNEVFAGRTLPLVFGEPKRWIALVFEALRMVNEGQFDRASELREQAFEELEPVGGSINGEAFTWIADGDSRIGPFLEAIVNGGYYWVPFDRVAHLEIEPPVDLRDFAWVPANFTWANGGKAAGFMPSRYPGSIADTSASALLCRHTEWVEKADDTFFGVGQRVFMTDESEYDLFDVRTLELSSVSENIDESDA